MRKENSKVKTKFISEPGSYLVNADYFAFVELKDYACYVMADGIDADEKKESAKLAVTRAIARFSEDPGMSKNKLKNYITAAHECLLEEAQEIRLEASLIIVVTDYKKYRYAHVGNCRLFLMRNGEIKESSKDTSLTQRMADNEEIALDQISSHEERNNLYAYLGQPGHISPVVSAKKAMLDGDIFILQTRGAWENVGVAELIDAVDGVSKAEEVCTGLEDVILSQRLEIIENYTIAAIFVDKIYKNPNAGKYKKIIRIAIVILMLVITLLGGFLLRSYMAKRRAFKTMENKKVDAMDSLIDGNYYNAQSEFGEAYEAVSDYSVSDGSSYKEKKDNVNTYKKMLDNICSGLEYIQGNNHSYLKAEKAFRNAKRYFEQLGEGAVKDTNDLAGTLDLYIEYCANAKDGMNYAENKDTYAAAREAFAKALTAKTILGIDDSVFDEKKNVVVKALYLDAGDALIDTAQTQMSKESYPEAITSFKGAIDQYKLAKELGSDSADSSISKAENSIEECNNALKVLGENAVIAKANETAKAAQSALEKGDYTKANELANNAANAYEAAGATDKANVMKNFIKDVASTKSSVDINNTAVDIYTQLSVALIGDDFDKSVELLEQLKKAYKDKGDSSHDTQIDLLISQIKAKKQNKELSESMKSNDEQTSDTNANQG